jgi:hypothetical protein
VSDALSAAGPLHATSRHPRTGGGATLLDLERLVKSAKVEELPALLGALERLRLMGLARLVAPAEPARAVEAPADPLELLTVEAVAKVTGYSTWTVRSWIHRRQLPVVVIGTRSPSGRGSVTHRVRRADLAAFIAERRGGT